MVRPLSGSSISLKLIEEKDAGTVDRLTKQVAELRATAEESWTRPSEAYQRTISS
jgi:hypothetical protein